MARRPRVVWATGISLALVLGSGLVAVGAGAFAEPPVDHAGSFAAISTQFAPSPPGPSATAPPRTAPLGAPSGPAQARDEVADDGSPISRGSHEQPIAPPTSASAGAPSTRTDAESHEATTGSAATTTTSSDDAHESPEHESPESEPPESEPPELEPDD